MTLSVKAQAALELFCVRSTLLGGGGVGTRPWWLALLACGGAYWPLTLEPSAMTSRGGGGWHKASVLGCLPSRGGGGWTHPAATKINNGTRNVTYSLCMLILLQRGHRDV